MAKWVLLANPPIYDFAAYDLFSKPLGLLYLASFLRGRGYGVRLLDCLDRRHRALASLPELKTHPNGTGKIHAEIIEKPTVLRQIPRHYRRYGLPAERVADLLREYAADPPAAVLVTSMMTYWYPAVADLIAQVRRELPGTPVGLGGVYARLMPEHAQQICQPDRLFSGNFEELISWLDSSLPIRNPQSKIPNQISPVLQWGPAYDLYPHLNYLTVLTSLGCPFHCDYCASRVLQGRMERLAPAEFVGQLQRLIPRLQRDQAGRPLNIAFMDDALLVDPEGHIIPILQAIRDWGLNLRFHCPNGLHLRYLSADVAELMAANRFEMIRLSYESAETPWQRAGDHKATDEDFRRAVANLEKAGYSRNQLEAYILAGLPGQSIEELEHSARAVYEAGVQVRLSQYSPIPGTALFETACREYGVDPAEPLLHNNSILPTLDQRMGFAGWDKFKIWVGQLNQKLALRQGRSKM